MKLNLLSSVHSKLENHFHRYPSCTGRFIWSTTTLGHKLFAVALLRFMYRCAGWFALTLVCLPWKKTTIKKANLIKNQQLAIRWCLIRLEESLLHRTEVRGITECMRWSGLLLVLANTGCLLYTELLGVRFIGQAPLQRLGDSVLKCVCTGW